MANMPGLWSEYFWFTSVNQNQGHQLCPSLRWLLRPRQGHPRHLCFSYTCDTTVATMATAAKWPRWSCSWSSGKMATVGGQRHRQPTVRHLVNGRQEEGRLSALRATRVQPSLWRWCAWLRSTLWRGPGQRRRRGRGDFGHEKSWWKFWIMVLFHGI